MDKFIAKLDKLDDEELHQELLEVYLNDPEEAYVLYRVALAFRELDNNLLLFRRLSKL